MASIIGPGEGAAGDPRLEPLTEEERVERARLQKLALPNAAGTPEEMRRLAGLDTRASAESRAMRASLSSERTGLMAAVRPPTLGAGEAAAARDIQDEGNRMNVRYSPRMAGAGGEMPAPSELGKALGDMLDHLKALNPELLATSKEFANVRKVMNNLGAYDSSRRPDVLGESATRLWDIEQSRAVAAGQQMYQAAAEGAGMMPPPPPGEGAGGGVGVGGGKGPLDKLWGRLTGERKAISGFELMFTRTMYDVTAGPFEAAGAMEEARARAAEGGAYVQGIGGLPSATGSQLQRGGVAALRAGQGLAYNQAYGAGLSNLTDMMAPLGPLPSILGPAAGAYLAGSFLLGGPVGVLAGAAMGAIGAGNYLAAQGTVEGKAASAGDYASSLVSGDSANQFWGKFRLSIAADSAGENARRRMDQEGPQPGESRADFVMRQQSAVKQAEQQQMAQNDAAVQRSLSARNEGWSNASLAGMTSAERGDAMRQQAIDLQSGPLSFLADTDQVQAQANMMRRLSPGGKIDPSAADRWAGLMAGGVDPFSTAAGAANVAAGRTLGPGDAIPSWIGSLSQSPGGQGMLTRYAEFGGDITRLRAAAGVSTDARGLASGLHAADWDAIKNEGYMARGSAVQVLRQHGFISQGEADKQMNVNMQPGSLAASLQDAAVMQRQAGMGMEYGQVGADAFAGLGANNAMAVVSQLGGVQGAAATTTLLARQTGNLQQAQLATGFNLGAGLGGVGRFGGPDAITQDIRGFTMADYESRSDARNRSNLDASGAALGVQYQQLALTHRFTTGEGMPGGRGFWQIEADVTKLGREQSVYGWQMEGKQMALQQSQFTAQWQAQTQQFGTQTQWQREAFGVQASRQATTRNWMRQDWATDDNTRAIQWGWQQEDMSDTIRHSTGRERRLAVRDRERSTVMHGIQEEGVDTERKRQKQTEAWEDEDFKRIKSQFEQKTKWQEESFARDKKNFDDGMKLQKEQHEKSMEFMRENWKLQDESTKLQHEYFLEQEKLHKAALRAQAMQLANAREALKDAESERLLRSQLAQQQYQLNVKWHAQSEGGGYVSFDWRSTGRGTGGKPPDERQHGGTATEGRPVLIGERGPEVFVPDRSGMIMPNLGGTNMVGLPMGAAGGGSGVSLDRNSLVIIGAITEMANALAKVSPDSAKAVKSAMAVLRV